MGNRRIPTIALVLASFIIIVGLMTGLYVLGGLVKIQSETTHDDIERVSLWILLFGAVVMNAVFATFIYIGISDWRRHLPLSALYEPQTAVKGTMAAYMLTMTANVLDLLLHNLQPRWKILYTPLAQVFQNCLLLAVFVSFSWVLIVLLQGRATDRARTHRASFEQEWITRGDRITSLEEIIKRKESRPQPGKPEDNP